MFRRVWWGVLLVSPFNIQALNTITPSANLRENAVS